ncbi:MAG TPA: asparagine synthase (glutamine-hydrolyzing) [Thermoanaerobaculia bacterium]|nr:asparagine synthase (glutamine-hydrolyzing) [Thermoanaerobaculia bacterium]
MRSMGGRVPVERLPGAVTALRHRGPDQQRSWSSSDRTVAFGHARLSVIDLTSGDQPISNETGDLHLVANGELYDYEEIRNELAGRGHRFRTRSDSEIALHLYAELGVAAVHRFRGEFALAIWDERNRMLFAARDRFGIKPLYWSVHEGVLYLASEVKALFAAGVPAEWDVESYATGGYILRDRTLYRGIHQVPPAHVLLAGESGMRLLRYWDLDYPSAAGSAAAGEQELVEEVRERLVDATRVRLKADVPVGVYLSGGIDSCAVLGMAATLAGRTLDAFTISFPHGDYDEAPVAVETARRAGARFHEIEVSDERLAASYREAVWHSETFSFNAHGVAKFILSRAVREAGLKVVLTGEGADEIFAGYPPYRRDMLLYNQQGQDAAVVAGLLEKLEAANRITYGLTPRGGGERDSSFVTRLLGFEPSWLMHQAEWFLQLRPLLDGEVRERFAACDPIRMFLDHVDVQGQLAGREPVHVSLYLTARSTLPNYVLTTLGDRMEMAHSIEGRLPILDQRVVEAVVRAPVAMKIRGTTEKYLLREAMRPFLTETVYRRPKHPFVAPPFIAAPAGSPLRQLMEDTLRGSALADLPFFDRSRVLAFLDEAARLPEAERNRRDAILMEILSLTVLQEHFTPASSRPEPVPVPV